MSNTMNFAERELDILLKSVPDATIRDFVPEILALCDKFGNSGQSGGSAPYVAGALSSAIKKLCLQQPICAITGLDDEWVDVSTVGGGDSEMLYQNSRCSALFKNTNSKAWYLDAIVWKNEKGHGWSGKAIRSNGDKVWSRQFVKSFPFTPKTFYIDIIEKEVAKDDWEFYVKDEKQLEEVFEYYDVYNQQNQKI